MSKQTIFAGFRLGTELPQTSKLKKSSIKVLWMA